MKVVALLIGSAFAITPASAQEFSQCDGALVRETIKSDSAVSSDYRMSQLVDEESYNLAKRDAGGNAIIYGVPVGASYSEYKREGARMMQAAGESLSQSSARSLLWTGLGQEGGKAYAACLEAVTNQDKLVTAVGGATESHVSLLLKWKKSTFGPETVSLSWQASPAGDVTRLPKRISVAPDWMRVQLRRPNDRKFTLVTINASVAGRNVSSSEVLVERFTAPKAPPDPDPVRLKLSGVSEIVHQLPSTAMGRSMTVSAYGTARQLRPQPLATMRLVVSLLTASGWSQKCGTDISRGDGLLDRKLDCSFSIDQGATRLKIEALNTDARAESLTADIKY